MRYLIKALVFDFDGLILDTETTEYAALQWLYGQHGQSLSLDLWGQCIGTDHEFDPIIHLKETAGLDESVEELRSLKHVFFERSIQNQGPRPGVVEYLEKGKELGLGLAVASSSPYSWVSGFLHKLGLLQWFDVICTADDVEEVKPNPALYQLAVRRLQIDPHEAIAFEDSPNGALGASRAGLHLVVIPNSVTERLVFGEYDLRLSSMADLPLEELLINISKKTKRQIS